MHYVVTLVEGNYLKGATVLFNSLVRNGFDGIFVVGYRKLTCSSLPLFNLIANGSSHIKFVELKTDLHFTNFKPQFMLHLLECDAACSSISYIDPDIVVNGPTDWIVSWAEGGPAVCGDVNWWMPVNHPTRRQWILRTGLRVHHQLDLYFNGGFVSVRREDRDFLNLWNEICTRW